jgi:hypothetical protein
MPFVFPRSAGESGPAGPGEGVRLAATSRRKNSLLPVSCFAASRKGTTPSPRGDPAAVARGRAGKRALPILDRAPLTALAVAASGRRDRWNHFHDTLAERCAAAHRDDPAFVVPLALGIGYAEKWDRQRDMLAELDERIARVTDALKTRPLQ